MIPQDAAMTAHATFDTPVLLRRDDDAVATLTLNRAGTRNALSEALMAALTAELDAIAAAPGIRAVILAANGPVFSAGHDLKEMTGHRADPDRGRANFTDVLGRCSRIVLDRPGARWLLTCAFGAPAQVQAPHG